MRQKYSTRRVSFIGRIEKSVIRIMMICAVLLSLFQLKSITDPVEFYFKIAGEIDSPAFKYSQYGEQNKKISLYFSADPEGQVLVKQNDQTIGIIGKGINIEVDSGTVYLDASAVAYPVTVNIIYNGKSYPLELNGNIKSFDIQIKSSGSL